MSDKISELIERISNSKKYRGLYLKTIERVVKNCFNKYSERDCEKKARNLLHQVWGAYFPSQLDFEKIFTGFEQNFKTGKEVKQIVLPILKLQSSVKERTGILNDFYLKVFAVIGKPRTIIDWACGLNPLSWPWMNLPLNTKYLGIDIDKKEVDFLNRVFKVAGLNNFKAELGDILVDNYPQADAVFLLKILPLLEHQQKGISLEVMKRIKADFLVVSFPTQTIGGRNKNMVDFYSKWFHDLIRNQQWETTKIVFPTELIFVVKK